MSTYSLKHVLILGVIAFSTPIAHADGTWNVNASGNWSTAGNWTPSIPDGMGSTANLTLNITGGTQVTIDTTSRTVGILNIGDADGTNSYTLASSGGAALSLNNNGSGAQINEISTADGDQISAPLVIADSGGLTITDSMTSTSAQFQINGPITGTGNLTIKNNSSNTGSAISFGNNATINNAGTLTFAGTDADTGGDAIRINSSIGSNVTSIIQSGATLAHIIGGQTISGTETYINNGTATLSIAQNNITGTGNLILENNTSINAGVNLSQSGINENINGTITSEGTGSGLAYLGGIGSGVTSINVTSTAMSGIRMDQGTITVNSGGTTLEDDSVNTSAEIIAVGGSTGTGDLIMENNGSSSINLWQAQYNNTGKIINEGTGSGVDGLNASGATIGVNVTAVVENSATSNLDLRLGGPGGFVGAFEVQQGTLQFDASSANFSNASKLIVGDTQAHATGAYLYLNMDSGTYTAGASQTISGFGTIQHNNITTVSGTTLAPGSTGNIGKLTLTNGLNLASGTNLTFALGAATANPATSLSSIVAVGGTLNLPALTLNLNLLDNAGANSQGSLGAGVYELLSYNALTGAAAGDISSLFNITGPAGFAYSVSDTGTSAGQIDLTVVATPEPGTWVMMLSGLALIVFLRRARTRKA